MKVNLIDLPNGHTRHEVTYTSAEYAAVDINALQKKLSPKAATIVQNADGSVSADVTLTAAEHAAFMSSANAQHPSPQAGDGYCCSCITSQGVVQKGHIDSDFYLGAIATCIWKCGGGNSTLVPAAPGGICPPTG